jgi:hypothetical protein
LLKDLLEVGQARFYVAGQVQPDHEFLSRLQGLKIAQRQSQLQLPECVQRRESRDLQWVRR